MTSVRYSVDGGAWNFSIHRQAEAALDSKLCTEETHVAMPNTSTIGNSFRWLLVEAEHTENMFIMANAYSIILQQILCIYLVTKDTILVFISF